MDTLYCNKSHTSVGLSFDYSLRELASFPIINDRLIDIIGIIVIVYIENVPGSVLSTAAIESTQQLCEK